MEYTVYYNSSEYKFNFNYIETVGDLQTVLIQAMNMNTQHVLFITNNSNILGIDNNFDDNLVEADLYNTTLFIVPDHYNAGTGTKRIYQTWLTNKIRQTDLMAMNRQLSYYHTLNNQPAPNTSFFLNGLAGAGTGTGTGNPYPLQRRRARQNLFAGAGGNGAGSGVGNGVGSGNGAGNGNGGNNIRRRRRRNAGIIGGTFSLSGIGSGIGSSGTGTGTGAGAGAGVGAGVGGESGMFSNLFSQLMESMGSGGSNGENMDQLIDQFMSNNNISDFDITFSSVPMQIPSGNDFFNFLGNFNNNFFESVPITLSHEGLARLPTFRYDELPSEISESSTCCSICRDDYENDSEVRVLLCRHYFHKDCIDRWLSQENVRCPLCRHDNRGGEEETEADLETESESGGEEEEEER